MPIRLLSDSVSSMIAAGEVVERPASVVKELVENALDAGATDISIDILGGGVEQIRVADNGCGIPSDEVELAFQRFATSKIGDASDLNTIHTLGFRGEALPSIASVARVSVGTRHADEEVGTLLELDSGSVVSKRQHGASPGTVMTVKQLFHNVPARRKFLRTVGTETSQIQNLVTRYALAYPEVRFALDIGSSKLLTTGSGDLREAAAAIYGVQVAEGMLDIAFSESNIGMLSPMIADELKEAEALYPSDWIADAFREAALQNARNWRYIVRILESWEREGRSRGQSHGKSRGHTQKVSRY